MKIAVIGQEPVALEFAVIFEHMGAEVTLFHESPILELEEKLAKLSPNIQNTEFEINSEVANILKVEMTEHSNLQQQWEGYYLPLGRYVVEKIKKKNVQIKRIQKRFLSVNEELQGKSRLHDLFRVVYKYDPKDLMESQLKTNPELFKDMPEEVIQSLNNESESYEDFDLIVESSKANFVLGSSGAPAINEFVSKEDEKYFEGVLTNELDDTIKHISVVGSNNLSALNILGLEDWLKDSSKKISIITEEMQPFSKLDESLRQRLFEVFDRSQDEWEKRCNTYQKELHDWRALPAHERVKISQPAQPESPIHMYNGFNVTSFDKLIDREGLFLTIEKPKFRDGNIDADALLTVGSDSIVNCKQGSFSTKAVGMRLEYNEVVHNDEPGFFNLRERKDIDRIKESILSFFSRK